MVITTLYLSLMTFLYITLAILTILKRRKLGIGLLSGGDDSLSRHIRAFGNLCEYSPLFLLLLLVAEIHEKPQLWLHAIACLYFLGRIVHAYALINKKGILRVIAMNSTFIPLLSLAILNLC